MRPAQRKRGWGTREVVILLGGLVVGAAAGLSAGARLGRQAPEWEYRGHSAEYWVRALSDQSAEQRSRAAYALGEADRLPLVGCAVLAEHLDDYVEVQEQARLSLIRWGRAGDCIAEAARMLGRTMPANTRRLAADVLRGAGSNARPAAAPLVSALNDPVPEVRVLAAIALGGADDTSSGVRRALLTAVDDPAADVRAAAEEALGDLPISRACAISVARRRVHDPDEAVRASAVALLGRADVSEPDLRRLLYEALEDSTAEVRASAATALGWAHGDTTITIAALLRTQRDSDPRVRNAAALALFRVRSLTQ